MSRDMEIVRAVLAEAKAGAYASKGRDFGRGVAYLVSVIEDRLRGPGFAPPGDAATQVPTLLERASFVDPP